MIYRDHHHILDLWSTILILVMHLSSYHYQSQCLPYLLTFKSPQTWVILQWSASFIPQEDLVERTLCSSSLLNPFQAMVAIPDLLCQSPLHSTTPSKTTRSSSSISTFRTRPCWNPSWANLVRETPCLMNTSNLITCPLYVRPHSKNLCSSKTIITDNSAILGLLVRNRIR